MKRWELRQGTVFQLGQCEAIIESLKYLPLSPDIRSEMLQVSLVKGAMATTAIEGNTLSETEVKLIENRPGLIVRVKKARQRERRELLALAAGLVASVSAVLALLLR